MLEKYKDNEKLFIENVKEAARELEVKSQKLKELENNLQKLFSSLNSDNYNEEELKQIFDELNKRYGIEPEQNTKENLTE